MLTFVLTQWSQDVHKNEDGSYTIVIGGETYHIHKPDNINITPCSKGEKGC